MAAAPGFYTIASRDYTGYNLTQRGSQIVLEAEDIDSPFQLWYKDDSWRYVPDAAGNPAFALINNGSKAALQADSAAPSNVTLAFNYNRQKDTGLTSVWTLPSDDCKEQTIIFSVPLKRPLCLGIGPSRPTTGDGVAVVLRTSGACYSAARGWSGWSLQPFEPKAYLIQSQWFDQILVAKPPHKDVQFTFGAGSFNNELTVVVVQSNNKNRDQEVWYRVPARSPLEDSNSSFIVIKKNGKALKGSTKSGDKVILTEFDPLDDNYVWAEQRSLTNGPNYLAINLANSESPLSWNVPLDHEYQNGSYNHPLTLLKVTPPAQISSQWKFVSSTC